MPAPKYPQGYPRLYHQIMDKLIAERPGFLTVVVHVNLKHARATFNYFRQSWLRHYEFLVKQKSHEEANRAYEIYSMLMTYSVGMDGNKLTFASKEASEELEFESFDQAPRFFTHTAPRREGSKEETKIAAPKVEKLFDEFIKDGLKEAEDTARAIFPMQKKEPIIPDNLPLNGHAISSLTEEEKAFFLAHGRKPNNRQELEAFLK